MIKVAICDDDKRYQEILRSFCAQFFEERIPFETVTYDSGTIYLNSSHCEDILLLDIEMEGIDGLAVKELLWEEQSHIRILFVSSHQEAMAEAFGTQVYGFLKKPLQYEQFEKKMQKILTDIKNENKTVVIESGRKDSIVAVNDILYIEAQGKYTYVHLRTGEQPLFDEKSIGIWEELLRTDGFAMSHKSYLVNLSAVQRIAEIALLDTEEYVPVSRRMKKEFEKAYRENLIKTANYGGQENGAGSDTDIMGD